MSKMSIHTRMILINDQTEFDFKKCPWETDDVFYRRKIKNLHTQIVLLLFLYCECAF